MDKRKQLWHLKSVLEKDKRLPLRSRATKLVFGEGNPNAKIYFLGEAPGRIEDLTGRPFSGPAGKLFDHLLESTGIIREEVFISNLVGFRPPQNRDPSLQEITAFSPMIDGQIGIINPKIIVTLGRIPMYKFLPNEKISQIHGQARKINWQGKDRIIIPMYHPAAALRSSKVRQQLKQDFQVILNILQ